jgi:hypothetical protein
MRMMHCQTTPNMGQHMVSPKDTKDVIKTDASAPTFHMRLIFNISALGVFKCF